MADDHAGQMPTEEADSSGIDDSSDDDARSKKTTPSKSVKKAGSLSAPAIKSPKSALVKAEHREAVAKSRAVAKAAGGTLKCRGCLQNLPIEFISLTMSTTRSASVRWDASKRVAKK